MLPHLDCEFKIGETVRQRGLTDFMIVKSLAPKRSNKGYTFWEVYCEDVDTDEVKMYHEWQLVSNENES
jgi:hypothetical protein